MIEPCFVSMCPKMLLLVRTVHTKVTSKAGNTDRQTDRRVIENETAIHLLQYYKQTVNRHTVENINQQCAILF